MTAVAIQTTGILATSEKLNDEQVPSGTEGGAPNFIDDIVF